ncbi:hypothetical protein GCM10025868_17260 [Angustibacter aerolatus]|uniref:DUF4235 domain-containing protein n=1 Tax=Angustibacter aerolatus TaxID=1162965 RepID=A0ABQ6JFZ9_9ACTN|nr:hypothetical protein GCM10025868_17260 [Angustibacter aerolatus]
MALVKTALTAVALGATAYSRVLGKRVSNAEDVPVSDGTTPSTSTPADVAAAQRQAKVMQWVIPAVTGALVVVSSFAGEQQRTSNVVSGVARRAFGR